MAPIKRKRGHGEGSIYPRKDGRWVSQVTIKDPVTGKSRRKYLYGKTYKEVLEKKQKLEAEITSGTYIEPSTVTFKEWLNCWLNDYMKPSLRPTTWASYETVARIHIIPAIGQIPLQKLGTANLQRLYNEKSKNGRIDGKGGLSSRTVHYIHQIIHGALEQAFDEGLITRNVSKSTKLPKLEYKEKRPLSNVEAKKFLSEISQDKLYIAFLVEIATGLRRGELLALRWEDIDFKNGTIKVRQTLTRAKVDNAGTKTKLIFQEPKTKKAKREIPLPDSVLSELKAHKTLQSQKKLLLGQAYQDNNLVICTEDGRPIDPRNLLRHHEILIEKAGMPKISFHDLRHTFATILLEMNEHPKVVQELLGHTKISTTLDIYSHPSLELKEKAMSRLNDFLTGNIPHAEDKR